MNILTGILVFSLIETVTVVAWFAFLQAALGLKAGGFTLSVVEQVVAFTILFVGYVIEHIVAFNVNNGRPWFSWPRK